MTVNFPFQRPLVLNAKYTHTHTHTHNTCIGLIHTEYIHNINNIYIYIYIYIYKYIFYAKFCFCLYFSLTR